MTTMKHRTTTMTTMRTAERIEDLLGRAGACDERAQAATEAGDHTKAQLEWRRMNDLEDEARGLSNT